MNQPNPELQYEEEAIARAIGIVRGRLHKARNLLDRSLWQLDHGRVAYTRAGVVALMAVIGVGFPEKKRGCKAKEPDTWGRQTLDEVLDESLIGAPPDGMEGLQRFVVKGLTLNPFIVHAYMMVEGGADYTVYRVKVKNSANFVKGMEVQARQIEGATGLYRMVGPIPRSFGRW